MIEKLKITDAEKQYLRSEKICTRAAALGGGELINEKDMSARVVLATETPAVIVDWERWVMVREILVISEKSVMLPESKQLPLLDSHSRRTTENIKGSIRDLQAEGNELVGRAYFAKNAATDFELVRDGHLTDVSVGYKTFPEHTVALPKGEKAIVEGREFVNDYEDGMLMLIRTKWQPKEGSLVAIGADENAKFRSDEVSSVERAVAELARKLDGMEMEIKDKIKIITTKGDIKMDEEKKKMNAEEIRAAERERIFEIEKFAERFSGKISGIREKAADAVREGKTVEEFRAYIIDNLDDSKPIETPKSEIGMSAKEAGEFSISRAILATASGDWSGAERELEAIKEVAKRTGQDIGDNRILIPREVQLFGARSLLAGSGAGANVVGTDLRGDEFIEFLRNKVVLGKAGMRTFTGLKENISISKQTAGATISMLAEGSEVTPSDPSLTLVTGSPNTISGATKFSRKLLIQSNPSIDRFVNEDLYNQLAVKIDYYGLHGSGTSPEPTGVANASGVGSVTMSTPSWEKIVEFGTDVESANVDVATAKWIMRSAVKGKLRTTLKAANTGIFLMADNGEVDGKGSFVTENALAQHLFFGDWSQLIFAEWGAVGLIVDPYTYAKSGIIEVTITDEIDFLIRNISAFAVADDVPTS